MSLETAAMMALAMASPLARPALAQKWVPLARRKSLSSNWKVFLTWWSKVTGTQVTVPSAFS